MISNICLLAFMIAVFGLTAYLLLKDFFKDGNDE